jgi:hypothetical protein
MQEGRGSHLHPFKKHVLKSPVRAYVLILHLKRGGFKRAKKKQANAENCEVSYEEFLVIGKIFSR